MPAWPGVRGYTHGLLHRSDRAQVARDLSGLQQQRGQQLATLKSASLEAIEHDPARLQYALQVGQSVFGDNCASCHGAGGGGGKGYPNLRDDVWLWGGSPEEIEHTIAVGVRSGHRQSRGAVDMPAFGREQMLTEAQVAALTEYVVALSGRPADPVAVGQAKQLFADPYSILDESVRTGTRQSPRYATNLF